MPTRFLIVCVSLNAVLGQLLLKRGTSALAALNPLADWWKFLQVCITSPWIWCAVAVQGFGYLLWMVVVSRVKLGIATASVGAVFYISTALLAWIVFDEPLTAVQWTGIVLVTIGVAFVSLNPLH